MSQLFTALFAALVVMSVLVEGLSVESAFAEIVPAGAMTTSAEVETASAGTTRVQSASAGVILIEDTIELDGRQYVVSGDQLIDVETISIIGFEPIEAGHGPELITDRDMATEAKPRKGHIGPLRGASYGNLKQWTDGVLPIEFEDNVPEDIKLRFIYACETWAQYGQIKCQLGSYKNRALRVSVDGEGCWSTLGMNSIFFYTRRLNLELGGCTSRKVILHEVGHSLGLIHEHQRADRDQYIEIVNENLELSFLVKFNFNISKSRLHTPYDFFSIMHYGSRYFSRDGYSATIVAKEPYKKFQRYIGSGEELSPLDQFARANEKDTYARASH